MLSPGAVLPLLGFATLLNLQHLSAVGSASAPAQRRSTPQSKESAHEPVSLFNARNLDGWTPCDKNAQPWKVVAEVACDAREPDALLGIGAGGKPESALLCDAISGGTNLVSDDKHADCELQLEFMLAEGGNSGVYLMGQYEVQLYDSSGRGKDKKLSSVDAGGIYSVRAPRTNAARRPGEWQTLAIVFRAPRFDAQGRKTECARFESVTLNGELVQSDVEVSGPTGGELPGGERAIGPIMLQGNHGPVAFRKLSIRKR